MKRHCIITFATLVFTLGASLRADTPKPAASSTASVTVTATPEKTTKMSTSVDAAAFKDIPTPTLQRQADKLADKIDASQNSINDLSDYADRVNAVKSGMPAAPPPELAAKVSNLASAFNVLKAAKPDEDVAAATQRTAGANFGVALSDLQLNLTSTFNDAVSKVVPSFKFAPWGTTTTHVATPAEQLAEDAASGVADPRRARFFEKFMPKLTALGSALYRLPLPGQSRVEIKRSAIDAEVDAAQGEVADLQNLASQAFSDSVSSYKKVLDAVLARLQDEIAKRKAAMDADNKQLALINQIIASRSQDVGIRQNTLTGVLFYTELLMIGAIAIAVIFLRVYPSHLAVTIVQERTLGDMLGMGLLLITVIFLSTGDFIDKSAVVTLLGTIAGYIFARPARTATHAATGSSGASGAAALPAPANLQEAMPHVAGQVSVSCNPVPGAIAYRWYTKLENAQGDSVFRQQTTEPHVTLTGFQAGNRVVITVTATNGQESARSAPLTTTIT
jgi:hypothetical protein